MMRGRRKMFWTAWLTSIFAQTRHTSLLNRLFINWDLLGIGLRSDPSTLAMPRSQKELAGETIA